MILHFAKENDFKVSQLHPPSPSKMTEDKTLGVTDCLALGSASGLP